MRLKLLASSLLFSMAAGCHTTPIPSPAVPPPTVAATPIPGPFDYSETQSADVTTKVLKKRLAVARFNDNIPVEQSPFGKKRSRDIVGWGTHVHQEEIVGESHFVPEQFTEKMIDSLSRTSRFVLIERKDINSLLREMSFGETKWVDKDKSARLGKVLGAQIIVTGAMSLNEESSTSGTQPYLLLLRMYDVETSRIVGTGRATGRTEQEVIDRAVSSIVTTMDRIPWIGKVASVAGDKLYLNAGIVENVKVGDRFALFSLGKPIQDPDSREVIGYQEEPAGTAEVISVTERVATLKASDLKRAVKPGDKAQAVTNP
jgi:curli biogenesis system outer membrane secretion channel CsgG